MKGPLSKGCPAPEQAPSPGIARAPKARGVERDEIRRGHSSSALLPLDDDGPVPGRDPSQPSALMASAVEHDWHPRRANIERRTHWWRQGRCTTLKVSSVTIFTIQRLAL